MAVNKVSDVAKSLPDQPHIVIVDDNHTYHSMRQVFKRLAIENNFKFGYITFQSTLESALVRNKLRDNPVPEQSLVKCFNSFESIKDNLRNFVFDIDQNTLSDLFHYIADIWNLPPPTKPTVYPTLPLSLLSAIDIGLRKVVGLIVPRIKHLPGYKSKMQAIVELRRVFYFQIKSNENDLLHNLIDDDGVQSNSDARKFGTHTDLVVECCLMFLKCLKDRLDVELVEEQTSEILQSLRL
ncbi:hypothetical protein GEMRC1_013699 [Eukaryota sp. GEM-RC1]